jgi:hypothetical protein
VFVRVVHRQDWDVEKVGEKGDVETSNFASRDQAMKHARSLEPDWIEVGEVVYATPDAPQHHRWTTLRRRQDGTYAASGLAWGGRGAR